MRRTVMRIFTAGGLAVALGATALTPVQAQNQVQEAPAEAATVSLERARETFTNLRYAELVMLGARSGLRVNDAYSQLSPTDQTRMERLFIEELEARRTAINETAVVANAGRFSAGEWQDLADLSGITYLQDLVMAGADPSRPTPNPASMTAADKTLFSRLIVRPYITRFFHDFDRSAAEPVILEAFTAAQARLGAE